MTTNATEAKKPMTAEEVLEELTVAVEMFQTYGDETGMDVAVKTAREFLRNKQKNAFDNLFVME